MREEGTFLNYSVIIATVCTSAVAKVMIMDLSKLKTPATRILLQVGSPVVIGNRGRAVVIETRLKPMQETKVCYLERKTWASKGKVIN